MRVGVLEVTQIWRTGERAVAVSEQDFEAFLVFACHYEIRDAVAVEVSHGEVEDGSLHWQFEGPGRPEGAITGSEQNCRGVGLGIGDYQVEGAVMVEVAHGDGCDGSNADATGCWNQVAFSVAEENEQRAVAVPYDEIGISVVVEVANCDGSGTVADRRI